MKKATTIEEQVKILTNRGVKMDFDENKVINNINHIKDNTFHQNSSSSNTKQFDPFEKIVELYKRLLKSEKEKTELLKNR